MTKDLFKLVSPFKPTGSQPEAIKKLVEGLKDKKQFQTLLGVTGSGKTFTIANLIQNAQKPTLIIAHNKTLAAQLYAEFKEFFPENRVEYFVSYYDYYQPESYIPQKDQYIEKDAQINPKIEQMRLSATASILSRNDTIIIASVSCIYGLGNPANYRGMSFELEVGQQISRKEIIQKLVKIQYERNDLELIAGKFRVKGDTVDIFVGYADIILRVEMFGDEIEQIKSLNKNTLEVLNEHKYYSIYPARHFVIREEEIQSALNTIQTELDETLPTIEDDLVAHRLKQRTQYDIEMIEETGYCKGIENYSRHFDFRQSGDKPYCLIDYFSDDFLLIIDESHQTIPQLHAMYNGDRSRKQSLIDYGFRLPSAFDNRPLKFEEFEKFMKKAIFVSATPGDYEKRYSDQIVEQIIRPTGLVDPVVEVRKIDGQMMDILSEIKRTIKQKERVLLTTLTKKLAEELAEYLSSKGIKTRYLHSEIDTLERTEIIRELRLGTFDVLVGINLLREGLDIPEVSFIGILDADKEGFLRDYKSLIQIIGRAARNVHSKVVLYADKMTDSMKAALSETKRRRALQIEYNEKNNITPQQIIKPVREQKVIIRDTKSIPKAEIPAMIDELDIQMNKAADELDFETAIQIRDRIKRLKERMGRNSK